MIMNKFFGMLGLAMRAGKLAIGEGKAEDAIRGGEAKLVILSDDASENTTKKFANMANFRNLDIIRPTDRNELGEAIGRPFAVIMAVTDEGFAKQLCEIYSKEDSGV